MRALHACQLRSGAAAAWPRSRGRLLRDARGRRLWRRWSLPALSDEISREKKTRRLPSRSANEAQDDDAPSSLAASPSRRGRPGGPSSEKPRKRGCGCRPSGSRRRRCRSSATTATPLAEEGHRGRRVRLASSRSGAVVAGGDGQGVSSRATPTPPSCHRRLAVEVGTSSRRARPGGCGGCNSTRAARPDHAGQAPSRAKIAAFRAAQPPGQERHDASSAAGLHVGRPETHTAAAPTPAGEFDVVTCCGAAQVHAPPDAQARRRRSSREPRLSDRRPTAGVSARASNARSARP